MLTAASGLQGYSLHALDGSIGKVKDFLFDDATWTVRYMVADSGKWLPGRLVLISPTALGSPEQARGRLPVELTRERIKDSPGIEEDQPVSGQQVEMLHRYYGWTPYWGGPAPGYNAPPATLKTGATATAATTGSAVAERTERPGGDPHLRSASEVTGYHIAATDGEIGHVEDLVLDDQGWIIRWAVVDTRNWLPGRKVLVAPSWIRRVDWPERRVEVDLTRDRIKDSSPYEPQSTIDREYEGRLSEHYGHPRYWV